MKEEDSNGYVPRPCFVLVGYLRSHNLMLRYSESPPGTLFLLAE